MKKSPTIAVIGAGPVGLEAARQAIDTGYQVKLLEKGEIASAVRKWQHVRLFSPREMNTTTEGRTLISDAGREAGYCETGAEFIESYLLPLSQWISARTQVLTQTTVKKISRGDLLKGDAVGSRNRHEEPFRLLIENAAGEQIEQADFVLDCSGVTDQPNWLGTGGIPCPGERDVLEKITYGLPDREQISEIQKCASVLIVGAGYSAATLVNELIQHRKIETQPKILWLTRNSYPSGPLRVLQDDPLPGRMRLSVIANQLALSSRKDLHWISNSVVERISTTGTGDGLEVTVRSLKTSFSETIEVERVVACTGYHPDLSLTSELQIHECYATSGPMKLAASLMGQAGLDCTKITVGDVETLSSPETGYYFLGARSYGRNSQFLMQTGYQQVLLVLEQIKQSLDVG
ncbi:FAD-dependent oxidoreductase [Rubinisphaera italica]|uniref:FAD dependent oxidoreductase n=1 Tax=Rubinisphaera italica TaxID=2527969 RepID=A0A5C5XGQ3_9PLAN|nr:FAD-dependent oxidoreductase [Rubinisphaera italica]TWT61908.1 FAD dependent oxidoreductase [Rubinisphaera italica]